MNKNQEDPLQNLSEKEIQIFIIQSLISICSEDEKISAKSYKNFNKILEYGLSDLNIDINQPNGGNMTILHAACHHNPSLVPILLENGADPFKKMKDVFDKNREKTIFEYAKDLKKHYPEKENNSYELIKSFLEKNKISNQTKEKKPYQKNKL